MMDVLLIVDIIISFSLMLGGYYMKYHAPKDKEMKMGVLTKRARTSFETWKYANLAYGKVWLITGAVYLVLGIPLILVMYYFKGEGAVKSLNIGYLIFLVIHLISYYNLITKELNMKFDENGNPKEQE